MTNWLGQAKKLLFVFCLLIVTAASLASLYEDREKILSKLGFQDRQDNQAFYDFNLEDNAYWANEITKGGYILHFRHAERDKWIDVEMYDALESNVHDAGPNNTRYAENDYFADAVCLNSRGKIQARAMGENLSRIEFPIGYVVTSPSCRARQTADLAFGGYDAIDTILVHRGPYKETVAEHVDRLRETYLQLPIDNDANTIVSAHNSVAHQDMFDNHDENLFLEEGGFYVISRHDGRLKLEWTFYNFAHFARIFHTR